MQLTILMPILHPSNTKYPKFYQKVRIDISIDLSNYIYFIWLHSLILAMLHWNYYPFSVTELQVKVSSINTVLAATSELASENRKRHTNTDSSLGFICNNLDEIYAASISGLTARSCCSVSHTDSVVGNFMVCMSNTAISAGGFFSNASPYGAGACDTSTDSCGGLAPD